MSGELGGGWGGMERIEELVERKLRTGGGGWGKHHRVISI